MIIRYVRVKRLFFVLLVFCILTILVADSRPFLRLLYPMHYEEVIVRKARQFQLDPFLVAAVIRVESKFDPQAKSPKGALGLMQLMPETAKWAAGKMNLVYSQERLFDPEFNISIGCWYLALLKSQFKGNTAAALAAYNGGRTTVNKWLEQKQWNGSLEDAENIPYFETRQYVRKVLRYYERYSKIYKD